MLLQLNNEIRRVRHHGSVDPCLHAHCTKTLGVCLAGLRQPRLRMHAALVAAPKLRLPSPPPLWRQRRLHCLRRRRSIHRQPCRLEKQTHSPAVWYHVEEDVEYSFSIANYLPHSTRDVFSSSHPQKLLCMACAQLSRQLQRLPPRSAPRQLLRPQLGLQEPRRQQKLQAAPPLLLRPQQQPVRAMPMPADKLLSWHVIMKSSAKCSIRRVNVMWPLLLQRPRATPLLLLPQLSPPPLRYATSCCHNTGAKRSKVA